MALTMFVIFMLVVIVSRVLYHYKISGDHGIRPTSRESAPVAKLASSLLIVCFGSILVLSLMEIYQHDHFHFIESGLINGLGMFVCLFAIALISYSQYFMGKNWRMGVDENEHTELVTTNIFSYIRNPIYTGVVIFFIGQYVLMPHVLMGVLLVMCILSIHLHVRYIEEPYLKRIHGREFEQYQQSTGRYLPRITASK